jgi:hypothetical protein
MNPRELVNHIRSGPATVVLDKPLRFRRRTCFNGRCNPCELDKFLHALESSETIQDVFCSSHLNLEVSEDEWVLLVQTLGRIRHIQNLSLLCWAGSRDFRPLQAFAEALDSAHLLCKATVYLIEGQTFPGYSSGLTTALANALREHKHVQEFRWIDCSQTVEGTSLDPVLRKLPACQHLRKVDIMTKYASAGAMKSLLQLPKDIDLSLLQTNKDHWLAVADGIRQGQCNIKTLHLSLRNTRPQATEAVKAIASAIRLDRNLEFLGLHMKNDITDEAGMALAEALTVNTTLREVSLSIAANYLHMKTEFGAPIYDAFSAMLRVNTSLRFEVPPFNDVVGDEKLVDSRNQMRIEQSLNAVGRGRLLPSSQTPRGDWVDALNELNSSNVDESPELNVSCLYSLLRLNPSICLL